MLTAKSVGDGLKTNYQSQEKVMFSEASASHSVQGGMMSLHIWSHTFLPGAADGHCSNRHASHWIAFLLLSCVFRCVCLSVILSGGGGAWNHYPRCIERHHAGKPPGNVQTCSTWTSLCRDPKPSLPRYVQTCSL